ncbi:DUF1775 domain-containing protein [Streptomyces scabiei]|uniref:DUF1775 domain-containing protein n=1 Tax=Streptomyces TaxID=1883 RepID=UPI001D050C9D|nr:MULTISPECIES: DUF1775 domain-containing protein [Streptomyces]MDX3065836.1 DUF1775 domain-containing protein [Streptomyces sp. ND04-05B]
MSRLHGHGLWNTRWCAEDRRDTRLSRFVPLPGRGFGLPGPTRKEPPLSPHRPVRTAHRPALAVAAALTTALISPTPASAHAEVESEPARALAENVTLSFTSEAESDTSGFAHLRVVLPAGIAPGDITLADAPEGWKLKRVADGYTVAGPALDTGVDAEHSVSVRRLPDAEQLVFKTVETYDDGRISRWVELPGGDVEPEQPAPVLDLRPASSDTSSSASGPSAGAVPELTSTASAGAASAGTEGTAAEQEDLRPVGLIVGSAVAVLLALGGGAWWLVTRRRPCDAGRAGQEA